MSKEPRVASSQSGEKVDDNENAKEPTVAPTRSGRRVGKDENISREPTASISRTSRTVKPTAKAKDAMNLQAADQLSCRGPKAKAVK